jgi:hypothetical protein
MLTHPPALTMSIEEAKNFHTAHVAPKLGTPVGASAAEVAEPERELRLRLPQDCKAFLIWMGQDREASFEAPHGSCR